MEVDDYWTDPFRLAKHINFLDRNRECSMSFNRFARKLENGRHFWVPEWCHSDPFQHISTADMALGSRIGNMSAMVLRSSAVAMLPAKFWDCTPADWGFGMALGQFGLIAYLKDVMSVRRIHDDGLWSKLEQNLMNERVLKGIDYWDNYFQGAFKAEFENHRSRLKAPAVSSSKLQHPLQRTRHNVERLIKSLAGFRAKFKNLFL